MASTPPLFTEQEAAVLLDAYLKMEYGGLPRATAVRRCSDRLRRMAIGQGLDINEIYRNVNGISFQMLSMESAWKGKTIRKPASRMFTRIVEIYRTERSHYDALLKEALEMENQSGEERFMTWLSGQVSSEQLSDVYMALWGIEQYALQNRLVKESLYENLDTSLVEKLQASLEQNGQLNRKHGLQMRQIPSALQFLSSYAQEMSGTPQAAPPECTGERPSSVRVSDASPQPEDMLPAADAVSKSADTRPLHIDAPDIPDTPDVPAAAEYVPQPEGNLSAGGGELRALHQTVNFHSMQDLAYTKPLSVVYLGNSRAAVSWKSAFVSACQFLLKDYPQVFEKIYTGQIGGRGRWLLDERHRDSFRMPALIGNGYYVETSKSAVCLMRTLRQFLDVCAVDYGDLLIEYAAVSTDRKQTGLPASESTVAGPAGTHSLPVGTADVSAAAECIPQPERQPSPDEVKLQTSREKINFRCLQDLAYTKPLSVTYLGNRREAASWRGAFVIACQFLLSDYPQAFREICDTCSSSGDRKQMWLLDERLKDSFRVPAPVGNGYYVEANRCSTDLMRVLRQFLDACAVNYDDLVIEYAAIPNATKRTGLSAARQSTALPADGETEDRSAFFQWMVHDQHMAENTSRGYAYSIGQAEDYAISHGFTSEKMLTSDREKTVATIQTLLQDPDFHQWDVSHHHRFGASLRKFLGFLASRPDSESAVPSEELTPYEDVLRRYFPKGYRLQSKVERNRFLSGYEKLNGQPCPLPLEDVDRVVVRCGIVCSGRVHATENMLSTELHNQILDAVRSSLDAGNNAVYYKALYQKFQDQLLDSELHDSETLRLYLIHTVGDQYHMGKEYLSRNACVQSDPVGEVRTCLQASAVPVSVEELCQMLPHLPKEQIQKALRTDEFISNGRDVYFHVDALGLAEDEVENIAELIQTLIAQQEYVTCDELLQAVKAEYPSLYDRGAAISVTGWKNVLQYCLGDRFSFRGKIISSLDTCRTSQSVYAEFAKTQHSFTSEALVQFGRNIGVRQINFDDLFQYAVRVDGDKYVDRADVTFQIPETDAALDRICTGNYLPLQRVSDFTLNTLPDASHPWTPYLLEQYVAFYSQRYRLLHNRFLQSGVTGAMVRRSCGVETFDALLSDALAGSGIALNEESALTWLSDNGYLARGMYRTIGMRLVEARALRNQRKGG